MEKTTSLVVYILLFTTSLSQSTPGPQEEPLEVQQEMPSQASTITITIRSQGGPGTNTNERSLEIQSNNPLNESHLR